MSKMAFIYPGQGAQKAGMGKAFYDSYPVAQAIMDQGEAILDFPLLDTCFEENNRLDQTAYTQPALVATCLAITAVLQEKGIVPEATAGLSLGAYAALATAGALTLEDAIRLVRKRGQYMEEAVPGGAGAMAAVLGMDGKQVEDVIQGRTGVYIANYNCPGQIVITGEREAVNQAAADLKKAGARRVLMLNVSGPFHSPMLKSAGEKLAKELESVQISDLKIPYVSNLDGSFVEDATEVKSRLVDQVSHSVFWQQSMEQMIARGYDTFIEIGPGKTLKGFLKKIDPGVTCISIEKPEDLEQLVN